MARLHEYGPDSPRSGYHLKGWTKHSGNTTLQVHYPCKLLFDWLDFQEGDKIPDELVTTLLDSNLLYTKSDSSPMGYINWTPSFDSISAELSEEQCQRLLGFLREYDGPRRELVQSLAENIDTGEPIPETARLSSSTDYDRNWRACVDFSSGDPDESLHRIAEQVSKRPFGLPEIVATSLQEWSDTSIEEFVDLPNLEESIQLFRDYPGRIHDIVPHEDHPIYFLTLPEADNQDPWPRFLVNHILDPQTHEYDSEYVFRVQIVSHLPAPLQDIYSSESIVHTTIVLDQEIHGWKVSVPDDIDELSDGERVEIEDQIRALESETVRLMEYLLDSRVDSKVETSSVEYEYVAFEGSDSGS
jgi:hypothetical protein